MEERRILLVHGPHGPQGLWAWSGCGGRPGRVGQRRRSQFYRTAGRSRGAVLSYGPVSQDRIGGLAGLECLRRDRPPKNGPL